MTEYQLQVPIGNLPVHLVLVGNKERGRVAFVRVQPFKTVVDQGPAGGVDATFFQECFHLGYADLEEQFEYETVYDYKDIPLMLRWLQQQNLQQPEGVLHRF